MVATQPQVEAPAEKRVESTLISAAQAIRRAYKIRYRDYNLNLTQASLLVTLGERGPVTQTQLSQTLHTGRAATGLVINGLEQRDLVERQENPEDRRAWLVALRPAGEALLGPIRAVDQELSRELRKDIPKTHRRQLAQLLFQLETNLAQVLAEDDD